MNNLNAIINKFASRKFAALIAGILALVFASDLNITPEQQNDIVTVILAYIGGQSVVDTTERIRAGRL